MRIAILVVAALAAAGCSRNDSSAPDGTAPDSSAATPAETLTTAQPRQATLTPTQNNVANGALQLAAEGDGVRITGSVAGLKPEMGHGFHIHENGDCSAPDASSAGEHFNPTAEQHGNPSSAPHHAGDMLNLDADPQGNARVDTLVQGVTLGDGGSADVVGKSIVVHERADDYTSQPSGNSGARIACGVIQ